MMHQKSNVKLKYVMYKHCTVQFTSIILLVCVLINARRMRMRITVVCLSVCLFVCLCVCYQSTDFLRGLYNKVDIPDDFTLISEGFQLRNFSKMLSFKSYSFNHSF